MIDWHKFRQDLAKNQQFSKFGQARAAYTAMLVGVVFGMSLSVILIQSGRSLLAWFLLFQCIFHLWEFSFNAIFHPAKLTCLDFLLPWQHSKEFLYAFVAALVEHTLECWLAPSLKTVTFAFYLGICLVVVFQAMRTIAMITAASNFTHLIADHKLDSHQLVTHGIYAFLRHPSYCGWFWWAIGTQVLLANPFCTLAYAALAWRFFDHRIRYEEQTLREYFGHEYEQYSKRVGTGIPFIK